MSTIDLSSATAEEIASALLALDAKRPGLAYDVGMILYEKGASKEFPGPPFGWYPSGNVEYKLWLTGYDPKRRQEAMKALREVGKLPVQAVPSVLVDLAQGLHVHPPNAADSQAGADEEAEQWRAHGFTVVVERVGEKIPERHTRTLRSLSAGPIG